MIRIPLRPEGRSLALIPPPASPQTYVAYPAAPLSPEIALMSFIVDDAFYDDPDVCSLPDCSVAFLMLAGPWSARNSRSGFVPSSMLARLSSDPDLVTKTLHAAGLIWLVEGGVQIATGRGLTVVNAADVAAEAAQVREAARERKRKSRANQNAGPQGKVAGVNDVTCDIPARSHVTHQIDRSDQDQSIAAGQSQSDAQAREAPELVTAVADAICAKVGYVPTDEQAREVIAVIRERARKAGKRIRKPLAYIPASVANEPDLWNGLLLPAPPPRAELAPLLRNAWDAELHEYAPAHPGEPCRCGYTKSSPRHNVARAG